MTASASSAADALVFDPSVQWPPGSPARYPCREHFAPVRRSIGGCLPCPGYVLTTADGKPVPELANVTEKERGWKIDLRSAALAGDCINCLLQSGQPFFVGRPGMGAPEEVACRAMTGRTHNADNMSVFLNDQRRVLKQLNGILTRSDEDALSYARCYAASVNASDIVVRVGGGPYMPLRKPNHTCARPGSKHHQKSDILISQSGHFPSRVLGDRGLNPWVIAAYHMTRELQTGEEERRLLPRIFAWTRALQGRTVLAFSRASNPHSGAYAAETRGARHGSLRPRSADFLRPCRACRAMPCRAHACRCSRHPLPERAPIRARACRCSSCIPSTRASCVSCAAAAAPCGDSTLT